MIAGCEHNGRTTLVYATEGGTHHEENQDSVAYCVDGEDFVIAVSDGVGSCPHAADGSRAAVDAALTVFRWVANEGRVSDPEEIVREVIWHWRRLVSVDYIEDYGATLKASMKIGDTLVHMSLGDGILAALSADDALVAPQDEKLFSNETYCLGRDTTVADFWCTTMRVVTGSPLVVFACTDGVSNYLRSKSELEILREIESGVGSDELEDEVVSLLEHVSLFSTDDMTIGVAKVCGIG